MSFFRKLFGSSAEPRPADEPAAAPAPTADAPAAPAPDAPSSPQPAWWDEPASEQPAQADDQQHRAEEQTRPLDAQTHDEHDIRAAPDDGTPQATSAADETAAEANALERATPPAEPDATARVAQWHRSELVAAALRDIGQVRSVNQDSVFAMTATLPRESSDMQMGLFVVADGMGGHEGGEIASRLAISTVVRHILAELVVPALLDGTIEALQSLIVTAVQEANRAIWEQAQTSRSDMGTTCTAALVLGHRLYIAHVGDSRLYLRHADGTFECLTTDHSAVGRLIQVGQLDPSEAREHPLRSQLYRTVGQQPKVQVDATSDQLGDAAHLLLCSDGLWGMLDDGVLCEVLAQALWPHEACRELIARANHAGGEDNIAAVVVALPEA